MELPRMKECRSARVYRRRLGGLCRAEVAPDGSLTDMEGVTTADRPAASTRPPYRFGPRFLYHANGLFAAEELGWVDGTLLYYGGAAMPVVLTDCPKTFAVMGSGVYIFPDRVRFDTVTHAVTFPDNASESDETLVCLCDDGGEPVTGYIPSPSAPDEPVNGMLWLDTACEPAELKQYSESQMMWIPQDTRVSLSAEGIGHGFREGDAAEVSGLTESALNGSVILTAAGEDFVAFPGILTAPYTDTGRVTVVREGPQLDFVCEHNNRLWGCSGEAHEIYACALGDASNWRSYRGLSTDSYALTVGSPGAFTGCAAVEDGVCFFKNGEILTVTGTRPADFRLLSVSAPGIAEGSAASAAAVNETLYYLSAAGVMRMIAAGIPCDAHSALGREAYRDASACAAPDGRYLICLTRGNGSREVLSYEAATGLWARESGLDVRFPVRLGNAVYGACGGRLVCLAGEPDTALGEWEEETERVSYFETADFGTETPDETHIGRVSLRLRADEGASVTVRVMYDGDGEWHPAGSFTGGQNKKPVTLPVLPRRAGCMRVRVEWTGNVTVYSVTADEQKD